MVNSQLARRLLSLPGVVSAGWGYKVRGGERLDRQCVVVGVEYKHHPVWSWHVIPNRIDGFETDVIEVGKIVALQSRMDKWRPAPGGVSIGHFAVTAGTLGCLVWVEGEVGWRILSNNHVLANCNDAQIGDEIRQPGTVDGGTGADKIAELEAFVPINFGGPTNYVDCAIALPLSQSDVSPWILDVGCPAGRAEAELGMTVKKSGRTTGLNSNTVQQVGAVAWVTYDVGVAYFEGQIITGHLADGGDSGSVVLDMSNRIVGLLFAGSASITIVNPFELVISALELDKGTYQVNDGIAGIDVASRSDVALAVVA